MFALDERLAADTGVVGDLPLCRVLLMRDANYPWLILVPRRPGLRELYQLEAADQQQYQLESNTVAQILMELFSPEKLNIAALGNVVPQLHIHHIVRYSSDPAWPKPVWGCVPATAYSPEQWQGRLTALREAFQACDLPLEIL